MVKQYRRQGLSLPEIKEEIEEQKGRGRSVEDLLSVQVSRLKAQTEEAAGQLLQAEALLAAMEEDAGPSLEQLVVRHLGICHALDPDLAMPQCEAAGSCVETLRCIPGCIDSPGMPLAVDVWLGPGSAEALRSAVETTGLRIQSNGEQNE